MAISEYHQKRINKPDEAILRRLLVKELELEKILSEVNYIPTADMIRVAILGCADKRFVKLYKSMFEKFLRKTIEVTTFDITIEHLAGEDRVIQHDITKPLPNGPYDITFGHLVLRFIEADKQFSVIKNSHEALQSPGLGIFIYDKEDISTQTVKRTDGYWSIPLEEYKQKLSDEDINFKDIRWILEVDNIDIPNRLLDGGALVTIK
jgi:hypothetical protein